MQDIIPLNLTDNIEALEALARNAAIKQINKPERLAAIGTKLYNELLSVTHDQEKCFIISRRYLDILDRLYKISDDKKYVLLRYGKEWDRVKKLIEDLKETLIYRYKEQANKIQQMKHNLKTATVFVPQEIKPVQQSVPLFEGDYISCRTLYKAIVDREKLLIIDVRPESDYMASRIKFDPLINIPDELITPGLSANTLGTKLNDEKTQKIWDKRDSFNVLVLLDWNSDSENVSCSKLDRLKTMIVEWDFNRMYQQHPVLLNGGFNEFCETYPALVTDSHVYLIRKNEDIDELLELDTISYPDSPVTTMKLKQFTIDTLEETTKSDEIEKDFDDQNLSTFIPPETPVSDIDLSIKGGELKQDQLKIDDGFSEETEESLKKKIEEQRLKLLLEARSSKPSIHSTESSPEDFEGESPESESNHSIVPPPIRRETKPQAIMSTEGGWCGLVNIRNTCYLNTTLQCLKCIPIIKHIFVRSNFMSLVTRKPPFLMGEFGNVIKALWKGTEYDRKVFRPTDFYEKVCKLDPLYKKGNHEDSMEFFLFLFNHLNDDCSFDIKRPAVMIEREKSWYAQLQGHSSFWVDLFYHQFQCTKVCKVCNLQAVSYETDNTLMLPVPSNLSGSRNIHLKDLINDYMEDNHIIDFKCSRCQHMKVVNKKNVVVAPEILVIVLKRYFQDKFQETRKNNAPVDFDLAFKFGNCSYKLYSVTQHKGTMEHGHYFAHGLISEQPYSSDVWVEFNDDRCTRFGDDGHTINHNESIKTSACAFYYYKQKKL